ncbi:histidine kinase [Naegleria gruberi]|uniref:Histidine kinase n=1 Tax=Naegleria gruberi TaxID=5762 RepID=D2UY33_NAEGR|nr:histidine kinase [Naegleria gruberi]EFC50403.1 histidine kinase [Naegleria gruberi]|eukprot:XP_002683147.1 histidine kinase [Naegleria gruberi strain NEG-M]
MNHLTEEDKNYYLCNVMVHEIHDTLHSLHDIAEDKVVKGEELSTKEVQFIKDLTEQYSTSLEDILPELESMTQSKDHVIIMDSVVEDGNSNSKKKMEFMELKNNLHALSLDIISKFENTHIAMVNEQFLYYCVVIVDNMKIRHLFLTSYRIYLTSQDLTIKKVIELYDLLKISKIQNENITISIIGNRGMNIFSTDIAKLRDELFKATDLYKTPLQDTNHGNNTATTSTMNISNNNITSPNSEDGVKIQVLIRKADKLRPSPKKRQDNPIFYMGIGNPEHFGQNRDERLKSISVKSGRSPEWNEQYNLTIYPNNELLLDVRLYSKVGATKNDFAYGVVNIPLKEILFPNDSNEMKPELKGKWEIWCGMSKTDNSRKEVIGDLYATIKLESQVLPEWLNSQKQVFQLPLICLYNRFVIFENCNEVPYVYGNISDEKSEIVGIVQQSSNNLTNLIDTKNRKKIYTLEKSSFLKKEYTIRDAQGHVFAKCFHKMKTIRKKKIRMYLVNGEYLYSMEGGCFDDKKNNNEALILNSLGYPVASVLFGDKINPRGNMMIVTVLDSLVDRPLLVTFCLYVLRTSN